MIRLVPLTGVSLAAVLLLGGCGADLHPGAAVSVGSQTLSQADADLTTRDVCTVLVEQSGGQSGQAGQKYATSQLQSSVVQSWTQRAMAEQLAEKYDVGPGTTYAQSLTQARQQLAGVDAGVRDRVLDIYTATPYFVDVLTAIGRAVLVRGGTASPSDQDSVTQGIDTAQIWEQSHPIETSPRYPDLELGDDSFTLTPDQSSVAVSTFAKQATADRLSQTYLDSLPASQTCG